MGLLSDGKPLSWADTKKNASLVKKVGIQQFLALYHNVKNRKDDLKWGDEVFCLTELYQFKHIDQLHCEVFHSLIHPLKPKIWLKPHTSSQWIVVEGVSPATIEYTLVTLDKDKKVAKLSLVGPDILPGLQRPESEDPAHHTTKWRPEYASYMIEGTPGATPYGGCPQHFNLVEANMKLRRDQLLETLKATSTFPISITVFPRIGCPNFTLPEHAPNTTDSASRSLFFPDEAIWRSHPRYRTLTRNIRERRGEKPPINVPVFKDSSTPSPFVEEFPTADECAQRNARPDHIYMDCMGFGMGCSCLQVTFQGCDITEARLLYDQLAVICPIMLALSAASPIYRGYLADIDCRWQVISGSVDDRTEEERGLKPLKEDQFVIPKSRYDTIDCYLASAEYNDVEVLYDREVFKELKDGGIDDLLAQHIAHLFIRDPISLFGEKLEQDIETETDHFENIQSTNWQSMRFKPPPPNSSIGWRVEFRPLEVQLTEFENAAFVVFVVLLTRAILSFKLNLYIPVSKMEENMKRAQNRNAVQTEKFYFRKSIIPEDEDEAETVSSSASQSTKSHDQEYTTMSVDTIINGKDEFPGVLALVRMYVNSIEMDVDTRCTILQYLRLISRRASGDLLTTASWIRQQVLQHPEYRQDSVVTESITYDLLLAMKGVSDGSLAAPELLGSLTSKTPSKYTVLECPAPSSAGTST